MGEVDPTSQLGSFLAWIIQQYPNSAPYVLLLTALIGMFAAISRFLPPPGNGTSVGKSTISRFFNTPIYRFIYRACNWCAINNGYASNACDPKILTGEAKTKGSIAAMAYQRLNKQTSPLPPPGQAPTAPTSPPTNPPSS